MKTTVEIPDDVYRRVKVVLAEQNITFRSLLEEALRRVLEEREQQRRGAIRDARYGSGGMTPELAEGGWEAIRDAVYEGRGA